MPASASFAIFRQTLQHNVRLHWHEFYEMAFIVAGAGTHIVNGIPNPLGPGSMFLLTPADFHEIHPAPGSDLEAYNVIFSREVLEEELYQLLFQERNDYTAAIVVPDVSAMAANFQRLMTETNNERWGHHLAIRATLQSILIDFARDCSGSAGKVKLDYRIGQHELIHSALIYIDHRFRGSISLADVARFVGLSPNYFSQYFHRAVGSSFQHYLLELRLRWAMSLLAVSDFSVTDICHSSGFNTLAHFERMFTRKFGKSAGAYRRDMNVGAHEFGGPPPQRDG